MLRISAKVDYGLRALVEMARAGDARTTVRDIADDQHIPAKFLGAILTELAKAGIVQGRRGAEGGYRLARPATRITLAQVLAALEGRLVEVPAAAGGTARLASAWDAIERDLAVTLDTVTIADLAGDPTAGAPGA